MNIQNNSVNIQMSNSEALVLFDFLSRFNEQDHTLLFKDQSEQRVLFDLECILETELAAILKANYQELLKVSQDEIKDKL